MRNHYYTYLADDEYALAIECLIKLENSLLSEGKYTDGVDDMLLKFAKFKKKKSTGTQNIIIRESTDCRQNCL